jgi:hypothetical protein
MKRNYTTAHQFFACILLISGFLQSCSKHNNIPAPIKEKRVNHMQVTTKQLADKPLISKEGRLVTICQDEGQLHTEVIEAHRSFSRIHTLPIYIAGYVPK